MPWLHLGVLAPAEWEGRAGFLQRYDEGNPMNAEPDYHSSLKMVKSYATLWIIQLYVIQNQQEGNLTLDRIVLPQRRFLSVEIWSLSILIFLRNTWFLSCPWLIILSSNSHNEKQETSSSWSRFAPKVSPFIYIFLASHLYFKST